MLLTAAVLEAGLVLAKVIVETHQENIRALPETERAEYARMFLEDLKAWRALVSPIRDLLLKADG